MSYGEGHRGSQLLASMPTTPHGVAMFPSSGGTRDNKNGRLPLACCLHRGHQKDPGQNV